MVGSGLGLDLVATVSFSLQWTASTSTADFTLRGDRSSLVAMQPYMYCSTVIELDLADRQREADDGQANAVAAMSEPIRRRRINLLSVQLTSARNVN